MVVYGRESRRRGGSLWWPEHLNAVAEGGGVSANLSHGMADLVSYGNAERDVEQVIFFFLICFSFYIFFLLKFGVKSCFLSFFFSGWFLVDIFASFNFNFFRIFRSKIYGGWRQVTISLLNLEIWCICWGNGDGPVEFWALWSFHGISTGGIVEICDIWKNRLWWCFIRIGLGGVRHFSTSSTGGTFQGRVYTEEFEKAGSKDVLACR